MQPTDALVVLTTVSSEDEGVALVQGLLDQRLIACGTLLPGARSLYRWQDAVADEREVVVLLKTRAPQLAALEAACGTLHPYRVPELLALEVAAGNTTYLDWLTTETDRARS